MKISQELKVAIRCVITQASAKQRVSESTLRDKAVGDFLRKNKKAAAAVANHKKAVAATAAAYKALKAFGLRTGYNDKPAIENDVTFKAQGGVIPDLTPLTFETFTARLALASPAQGITLLKSIGINWD